MVRRAVTHAVVVDRDRGRPLGVLSALDVARVLALGRA
jgi:CBS domain-containing protein